MNFACLIFGVKCPKFNRPSSSEVKIRGTIPPFRHISSWHSVSVQDQLYLYVEAEGARLSKNLEEPYAASKTL
jgi:hypothetical protein